MMTKPLRKANSSICPRVPDGLTSESTRQQMRWSDLKVLITGASGFIGHHLCRRLYDEGSEVHATSRRTRASVPGGPVWWQADMADAAQARRIFTTVEPHIVFHLAGSVGARPDLDLVLPTYHSLLTSTVNVLLMAAETGCARVVLAGSLTEPMTGERDGIPASPYAAAKWASSAYGRMFQMLYGTPVVIVRPFMTYGPAQAPTKLIPSVALSLLRGAAPKVSSGKTKADWVYIDDVVDGFLRAARKPGIEGRTIDLGTGTLVSVRDVVTRLVNVAQTHIEALFGALPDRPAENEFVADTATASELLGWTATTPLDSGLRQTFDWFRAHATAEHE
jgi:UDP-glucose 4-epimerase